MGDRQEEMQQVMMLQQAAALQMAAVETTSICWKRCMGTPSTSLSRSERNCLTNCAKARVQIAQVLSDAVESHQGGGH